MIVYAVTIFVSAFLLFQVQPMIAKMILPWFGGSAAVWTTSLMFFQVMLLGGYAYSYCVVRFLRPKYQAYLHIALLLAAMSFLPILPSPEWKLVGDADPTLRILGLLATTIGLPYLLLSATGPLLQAWYLQTNSGAMPYRLYALSNLGSMLALITFPVLVEPLLATYGQAYAWSAGFVLFAALCGLAAWSSRNSEARVRPEKEQVHVKPSWTARLLWISFSACASALLLAITNHMSQNVAPIPFLWILPLSLYLLTFILCFESDRAYRREIFIPLLALSLGGIARSVYYAGGNGSVHWLIPVLAAALFVCCMVCHGELARLRPDPHFLTLYYLMVSIGGALGGLFVAIVSPRLFVTNLELPVSLVACAVLVTIISWSLWSNLRYVIASATIFLATYVVHYEKQTRDSFRLNVRNFYGVLHVRDDPETEETTATRVLEHGTINHGEQLQNPLYQHLPTSYYGNKSGVGKAMEELQKAPSIKVGVIGLGAGVLASYCRTHDQFRFYEINPLIKQIATEQFTFLPDCPADKQILLGDARLVLERQSDQNFDLLVVDAFSSDSIPVHLLTKEAFELYFRHLKRTGILAVHISNKYLNLEPVVRRNASVLSKSALVVDDEGEDADYLSATTWVLVSSDPTTLHGPVFQKLPPQLVASRSDLRTWTDDYSNLFQILK
jgi:hypothetical protein